MACISKMFEVFQINATFQGCYKSHHGTDDLRSTFGLHLDIFSYIYECKGVKIPGLNSLILVVLLVMMSDAKEEDLLSQNCVFFLSAGKNSICIIYAIILVCHSLNFFNTDCTGLYKYSKEGDIFRYAQSREVPYSWKNQIINKIINQNNKK